MKVMKVLNSSVVLVKRSDKKEVIALGKGIGFKSKPGDFISEDEVEKIYVLESEVVASDMMNLMRNTPNEYLILVDEIITHAKKTLRSELCENIYVSLTDHLHIAAKRVKNNIPITNRMLWEIQKLYPLEYEIGKQSLILAKERIGVEFPEEEAGNIAFHLVNAQQTDGNMEQVLLLASIVKDILNIVKITFNVEFDTFSVNYSRFINHLQFFSQRLVESKMLHNDDDELSFQAARKYTVEHECAISISEYVAARFDKSIPNEEMLYLIIHINRVIDRNK